MSTPTAAPGHRDPATLLPVVVAALVVAGILWFGLLDRQASLNRSQVGFAGLETWLNDQGIETLTFRGGGALQPGDIGLRVLPLYDADLKERADDADTEAEILQQKTEVDIRDYVLQQKIERVPTLVILPKWRRAVRTKGIAHPAFLIPEADVLRVLNQISSSNGALNRSDDGYNKTRISFQDKSYSVGLYQPQFVEKGACTPVLGSDAAMLLGKCMWKDTEFWLLSDPDLLNSHGLKLGDNAALGRDLLADLAGGDRIVIDLTSSIFITERPEPRSRSWSELSRFFAFPFSIIWIGFALLSALFLWRAWVRYGPIIRLFDDRPRASKTSSIEATARLLRLSGHDRELLQSHIAARCRMLAADLLGPHGATGADPVQDLIRIVSRRSPELANDISRASMALRNETHDWSQAELLRLLDRFESLYERTLHEFGRSADARPVDQR